MHVKHVNEKACILIEMRNPIYLLNRSFLVFGINLTLMLVWFGDIPGKQRSKLNENANFIMQTEIACKKLYVKDPSFLNGSFR